jgi:hypothetical protein
LDEPYKENYFYNNYIILPNPGNPQALNRFSYVCIITRIDLNCANVTGFPLWACHAALVSRDTCDALTAIDQWRYF